MAKFCTSCGNPLGENETCSCSKTVKFKEMTEKIDLASTKGFFEKLKNRMGIGDPDLNKGDAFESNKQIVPECVKANESEIPVKQYKIATLRNRILGISYTKAIGRLQVTNKRVIFRAPGRCLAGRTTLQHEFTIDEIAGIEARREYVFSVWDWFIAFIVWMLGAVIPVFILDSLDSNVAATIIAILFGVAGCVPFFMLKKKWLLKLFCLGASCLPLIGSSSGFLMFLGLFPFAFSVILFIIFAVKPNLVMVIKTKGSTEAIDIKRKKSGFLFFGGKNENEDHTGFKEIIPEDDAEKSIREIGALINDIQKLGDFGIEKWKK